MISDYLPSFSHRSEGNCQKPGPTWSASTFGVAERLELGEYLFLGAGEEKTGGRKKEALLADAMEALIAAVYLEHGWEKVKDFILSKWQPESEVLLVNGKEPLDPKTELQELLQSKGETPRYHLLRIEGPDHDRLYTVNVYYREKLVGTGKGRSKKEAEQEAAKEGLKYLQNILF